MVLDQIMHKLLILKEVATILYFINYSYVVIILFSASLYKSAFSTYSVKRGFRLSVLWFFVFPFPWFLAL